jgi:hypothetical protein
MKNLILWLIIGVLALVFHGCTSYDTSRAVIQPIEKEMQEKVAETITDKQQTIKTLHAVLKRGLILPEQVMYHNKNIVIDEKSISFKYGMISSVGIVNEGKEARVWYDGRDSSYIRWIDLVSLKIRGPLRVDKNYRQRVMEGKDYYEVQIRYKGLIYNSGRDVNFASLEGAKVFSALLIRMAELSGNPDVKNLEQ